MTRRQKANFEFLFMQHNDTTVKVHCNDVADIASSILYKCMDDGKWTDLDTTLSIFAAVGVDCKQSRAIIARDDVLTMPLSTKAVPANEHI